MTYEHFSSERKKEKKKRENIHHKWKDAEYKGNTSVVSGKRQKIGPKRPMAVAYGCQS